MKRAIAIGAALLLLPLLVRLLVAQSPPPSQSPPPPPTYTLTDLGRMDLSAAPSGPAALNSNGQVGGLYFNYTTQLNRAFSWSNGTLTDLGTLGGALSFGYGINAAGQVVGTSSLSSTDTRATIWQNGVPTNLGDTNPASGLDSQGFGINSNGDVAGYEVETDGYNHAVIWKGGTHAGATLLPSLACNYPVCHTQALAINDAGQAAGWSIVGSGGRHPVIWSSSGQATDLGSLAPGNFASQANAINSNGTAVGYSQIDPSTVHAFVWQNGTMTDLGAIAGIDPLFGPNANITDNSSSAWGINSKGDVVGISAYGSGAVTQGNGGRAFLYTNGTMYDLLSLVPSTNWKLLHTAWAINDAGQIVGIGIDPTTNTDHGFLLTPIITPTTTTLSSSLTPSVFGQQVSFTTTVTPTQASPLTPTGSVTFNDTFNGVATVLGTATLSSGTAIFNTSALGVGAHTITASYAGDNNFGSSTSTAVGQTANQAGTTTTLAVSPSPANFGQAVTLTATVTVVAPGAGTPTGTVSFLDGTTTLGTAALNSAGNATFSTSSLTNGSHSLTASYSGDTNFSSSASAATNLGIVLPAPAITSPASGFGTTNPSVTVTGTGTFGALVAILDGTTTVGSIPVDPTGNFIVPITLTVGVHSLTATQTLGTATSAASAAVSITVAPPPPVITSPASGFSTSSPAITVSGTGLPGATVTVLDVNIAVGTGAVTSAGSFAVTVTLAVGAHSLTATQTLNGVTSAASAAVTGTILLPPVMITDHENVTVTDAISFPDVPDTENITVTDQVSIQVLNTTTISISAPSVAYGTAASALISVSSPTAAVSGSVTLSVDGGAASTLSLTNGSVTFPLGVLPAGGHLLAANFAAQGNFLASSAETILRVQQATPTITWATPAPITYGAQLSNTQLNAAVSGALAGTLSYSPGAGTVLTAGSQTLSVTFTPTDANYTTATATVTLVVNKATPTISWATPATIFYPAPLSGFQLNATVSVSGSFVYSPPAGTVLGGGAQTLSVTFTATDSTDYTTAMATVTIMVIPAVQIVDNETITVTDTPSFPDVFDPEKITVTDQVSIQLSTTTSISVTSGTVYGTPASVVVSVGPSTTVTGNVTLSVDGGTPSTMSLTNGSATFNNLGVLKAGNHSLVANFAAQGSFMASSAQGTFVVNPATPTITWATPAAITYGTQLSSTQLNATASVAGTFTYKPPAGAVLTGGKQTLTVGFTPTDTTDYTTATATVTLLVNPAPPAITWANPAPIPYGTALSTTQLNATASVAGTFTYKPAAGAVLTAGSQPLTVAFTPTDMTDYTTATATVTLLVNPATPTITWANPAPIIYGTQLGSTQLNATSPVAGTFVYNPPAGTVLGAGSQTLRVVFAPSDTVDYTKANASVTLVVNQATAVITWLTPGTIVYGTALSGKQLDATASVAGTLVFNPAAGTVLTAGSQTLSVIFAPSDTVDYTKAAASVTLIVNQATPTITWANPAPITLGTPLSSTQLNANASFAGTPLPGTFVYNPPLKTVLSAGTQTLSVTFTPTDTRDYQTVTQSVSITVNVTGNLSVQPGQTYTFSNGSIAGNATLNGGTLTLNNSAVGGNLTMSSGTLTLSGNSTVGGNVQIQGGSFTIGPASIKNNLTITNVPAGKVPGVVCGASVSGDLQFEFNGIPGQIGPASCSGNTIGGNLLIMSNTAPLQIFKNSVAGNLQVQSNTGSAQVFSNTVQGSLQCQSNSSPFTGGGNTAASKQGQCASF